MSNNIPIRGVVTPKDYSNFLGCSERNARDKFQKARLLLNKEKHHLFTAREFCSYFNVDYCDLKPYLEM